MLSTKALKNLLSNEKFLKLREQLNITLNEFLDGTVYYDKFGGYLEKEKEIILQDLAKVVNWQFSNTTASAQPSYRATAGAPGCGQSLFLEAQYGLKPKNAVYIEPDRIGLPSLSLFQHDLKSSNHSLATAYHKWRDASNFIANFMFVLAIYKNINIVHGTTATNYRMINIYQRLKQHGYQLGVEVLFAHPGQRASAISHKARHKGAMVTPQDAIGKVKPVFLRMFDAILPYCDQANFYFQQGTYWLGNGNLVKCGEFSQLSRVLTITTPSAMDALYQQMEQEFVGDPYTFDQLQYRIKQTDISYFYHPKVLYSQSSFTQQIWQRQFTQQRTAALQEYPMINIATPPIEKLIFINDIEGDLNYLQNVIALDENESICFSGDKYGEYQITLKGNVKVIFGGDAGDGGPYNWEIYRILNDLKQRYPHQVILLYGNRDLNKIRWTQELTPEQMKQEVQANQTPYWITDNKKKLTFKDYLLKHTNVKPEDILAGNLSDNEAQILYLKWMLPNTMGCPKTFGFYQEELAMRYNKDKEQISDLEVLQACKAAVGPKGVITTFLQHAQSIASVYNVLLVHGTINNLIMLGNTQPEKNIAAFIDNTNQTAKQHIAAWCKQPFNKNCPLPGTDYLNRSALPEPANDGHTVIYSDLLDHQQGIFVPPAPEVVAQILAGGYKFVFSGHRPAGNSNFVTPVNTPNNQLCFFMNDTRYSGKGDRSKLAANLLTVHFDADQNATVMAKIKTHDGNYYHINYNQQPFPNFGKYYQYQNKPCLYLGCFDDQRSKQQVCIFQYLSGFTATNYMLSVDEAKQVLQNNCQQNHPTP